MYVSSSSSAILKRLPGYSISFERKKQYEQSRLHTAPVGFARRWNARGVGCLYGSESGVESLMSMLIVPLNGFATAEVTLSPLPDVRQDSRWRPHDGHHAMGTMRSAVGQTSVVHVARGGLDTGAIDDLPTASKEVT